MTYEFLKTGTHFEWNCITNISTFKGQQGYPLSAIVVDPGQRLQPLRSDRSAETSVHLIYQKNQGMQHPISQYVIINCPIVVKHNSWSANRTADIDSLIPTLSHHVTQVII